jgi:hypothetical protein
VGGGGGGGVGGGGGGGGGGAWEVRAVCVGLKKMHTPVPTWDGCTWLSEVRQCTHRRGAVCHCLGDCGLYLSVERIT